ncbi:MAG: Nif11-like leader peptide family natural product precursor [Parasulfuritortus sp.]|jgi:predicted ribosomally synthesized peptide with nif11-like leader|nr:Nif11-like leader peptide family natural product precursor [Parasulfuritortus sp.]
MSVESAKTYITRMRNDPDFRQQVNHNDDEAANWAFLKANGYEFTLHEFKLAQEAIYQEHGIVPEF